MALNGGVHFWTSLGSPHRFNGFDDDGRERRRPLRRLDTWGPMDNSRGRRVQSYIDLLPNPDDGSLRLQGYHIGSIPARQQCEEALKRWLMWHELDSEK